MVNQVGDSSFAQPEVEQSTRLMTLLLSTRSRTVNQVDDPSFAQLKVNGQPPFRAERRTDCRTSSSGCSKRPKIWDGATQMGALTHQSMCIQELIMLHGLGHCDSSKVMHIRYQFSDLRLHLCVAT